MRRVQEGERVGNVNREGGDRKDRSIPLEWVSRVTRIHKARHYGPRIAVKGQHAKTNKGPGREEGRKIPRVYR